jgi:hypothetical protein
MYRFLRGLIMFFDWLTMYQEFDYELPVIAENGYAFFDFIEGEFGQIRQGKVHHKGSYDTSIQVHVNFNRLEVSGNPSRFNRLDNLFGFTSLEDCVAVYNSILASLGLPAFTKCTSFGYYEPHHGDGTAKLLANGAVITCLHITKNMRVGEGCVDAYLRSCLAKD